MIVVSYARWMLLTAGVPSNGSQPASAPEKTRERNIKKAVNADR